MTYEVMTAFGAQNFDRVLKAMAKDGWTLNNWRVCYAASVSNMSKDFYVAVFEREKD